jgi:hypothetical protein
MESRRSFVSKLAATTATGVVAGGIVLPSEAKAQEICGI